MAEAFIKRHMDWNPGQLFCEGCGTFGAWIPEADADAHERKHARILDRLLRWRRRHTPVETGSDTYYEVGRVDYVSVLVGRFGVTLIRMKKS